jgi:hypothetical protein
VSSSGPPTQPPPTLSGLVAAGVLDATLAGLVWLLLQRGVPVLVAGADAAARAAVAGALETALPPERRPGAEPGGDRLVRVATTLDRDAPPGMLRAALAATTRRGGLLACLAADDLAGVLDLVTGQGLTADETSFLGVVVILGAAGAAGSRVEAAHYLRPVVRDAGGHPRRLGPAVLAAWDARSARWEDFAWGIGPDLAERCGMRAGDFERQRAARAATLSELAAARRLDPATLEAAAASLA